MTVPNPFNPLPFFSTQTFNIMNHIIVGLGEALWDCLPQGRQFGGAPANFAYQASQYGWRGFVVSAIGNDPLGDEVLQVISSKGLEHSTPRTSYPTGTVQITLDGAGVPAYHICENVAWDHIPWTAELEQLAGQTRAACFGTLACRSDESRTTIFRFLDTMPDTAERVFDINLRQHYYSEEVIVQGLERATLLKLNDEEIEVMSRFFHLEGNMEAQCRTLLQRWSRLHTVILTCGVKGSYVFTRSEASFRPTPQVEVADTVGAGDAFAACYVAQILNGKPVGEAHRRAVEASAYVCTQQGAMPVMPKSIVAN